MQRKIHPAIGPIRSKITVPGSANMTNRALILAALANGVSEISGIRINKSTSAFIDALHQVGIVAQLDKQARSCIIAGGNGKFPQKQATFWCHHAKTAAYFLIAASSITSGVYYFDGEESLRAQKISCCLSVLRRQGIQFIPSDVNNIPFTLIGADTLEGGDILLDDYTGPTFISALLMIAPYARSPLHLTVPQLTHSHAIDMTCAMMAEFGVLVHRIHQGQFMVPVPQRYQARDYTIEPDFSLASYFFAAAAITGGEITIQSAKPALSKQPFAIFLSLLEKMGCRLQETQTSLTVQGPTALQGIEVSIQDFSDAFLILSALAPFAHSPTRIAHIGHLTDKEHRRFIAMKDMLENMNVRIETGPNWIKIFPGIPKGTKINVQQDPQLAMACAIIGLKIPNIVIETTEDIAASHSYFFSMWNHLAEHTHIEA